MRQFLRAEYFSMKLREVLGYLNVVAHIWRGVPIIALCHLSGLIQHTVFIFRWCTTRYFLERVVECCLRIEAGFQTDRD